MKRFFYFIIIILIAACKKDSVDTNSDPGVLEGFLTNHPDIIVQKTTYAYGTFNNYYSTHRGFIFKPLKDIKISAVGGKIAGYGTFKIEIFHNWLWERDTLLVDSISINNTAVFQFKNIKPELILNANELYLIRCFNINHNFVYDAGLGYGQSDTTNIIEFPLTINDIQILSPYYTYINLYNGNYFTINEGLYDVGIFRGLVDFKYELKQ
jgi:hypothetical protein